MSPSAEWEAAYTPVARDYEVADRVMEFMGFFFGKGSRLRNDVAREIGIAIARAVELELVP
jgi:hypothetical protein